MRESGQTDVAGRERAIELVLFLGVLMGALDIAVIAPAFTRIQEAFAIDERSLIWIFSVYVLFNLVCTPFLAGLSDQWGRRGIYMVGIGIFALGSLVVAVSWNFTVVIVGRALQGFGSGGIFPIAAAIIGDTFRQEKKGGALGYLGAVFGVAFILGPVVGGLLVMVDWHLIFLVNIPIAAYVIIHASTVLPAEARVRVPLRFDWAGMILLATMLGSLAWGLNRIETRNVIASLADPKVWPFLAAPAAALPLFIFNEIRNGAPVLPVRLFRKTKVAIVQVIAFGAGALTASLVFIPALAMSAFNVSAFFGSLMMIPAVIAMSIGSLFVGRLVDRFGAQKVVLGGIGLIILSSESLGISAETWTGFFISTIFLAMGYPALIGAPLRYIMLEEAAETERSAAQGMISTIISVGQLMGSAFLGALISSQGGGARGYRAVFIVQGMLTFGLFVCGFFLRGGRKRGG